MANKAAVVWITRDNMKGLEGQTAQLVMRRLFFEGEGERREVIEADGERSFKVKDLCLYKGYDVYVLITGIVFVTLKGLNNLLDIISRKSALSMVGPVSNVSTVERQRHSPPFFYQTISVFRWAVEEIHREFKDEVAEVDEIDDFCLAFRRELLDGLPGDLEVTDLPKIIKDRRSKCGIARGVYAHRYGNCYESGREDLLRHVPPDARDVLDIGCAEGLFGEMLKKRQRCSVTGIDTDRASAEISRGRLDSVILGDIEEVIEKGILGLYDCIICGDVLEHLNNPWKVLKGLRNNLGEGGIFIASSPNVMNWAVIYEQLRGRWDYIPFSILSGTHIRFFTKKTFAELFEGSGYRIKEVFLQSFEIPSRGAEFIAALKRLDSEIIEEELKAHEIVVVAEG